MSDSRGLTVDEAVSVLKKLAAERSKEYQALDRLAAFHADTAHLLKESEHAKQAAAVAKEQLERELKDAEAKHADRVRQLDETVKAHQHAEAVAQDEYNKRTTHLNGLLAAHEDRIKEQEQKLSAKLTDLQKRVAEAEASANQKISTLLDRHAAVLAELDAAQTQVDAVHRELDRVKSFLLPT